MSLVSAKKWQIIVMVVISLICLTDAMTTSNYYLKFFGMLIFAFSAIGSCFRKSWVKYSFYIWGMLLYARGLFLLLGYVKSGTSHILLVDNYIHIIIEQWLIALLFFAFGNLAQYFFDSKNAESGFAKTNFLLPLGIAMSCFVLTPITMYFFTEVLDIFPTVEALIERSYSPDNPATNFIWKALWPITMVEVIVSATIVLILAIPFIKYWALKQVRLATLFLPAIYTLVFLLHFLISIIKGKWSGDWFFNGWDIVLIGVFGIVAGICLGGLMALGLKHYFNRRAL